MTGYSYFLPQIRVLPPPGYTLHDAFNLDAAAARLRDPKRDFNLTLRWQVIREDAVIEERVGDVLWRNGRWENMEHALFECRDLDPEGWRDPTRLSYLERSAVSRDPGLFTNYITESGYGIYGGEGKRMLLVGASVKFASPTTIRQVADIGRWIEAYPAAESNPSAGFDMSIILTNPFLKEATVSVEFTNRPKRHRIRVPRRSVRRIGIADLLGQEGLPWQGAIFVTGANRQILAFVTHEAGDPTAILAIQHSEPYRGIEGFEPLTRQIRRRIGTALRGRGRVLGPGP